MWIAGSGQLRTGLRGASVIVAVFLSCSACNWASGTGSQAAASKSPVIIPTPSAPNSAKSAGSTVNVDVELYSNSGLTVTLTTIAAGPDGQVTADVVYRNTSSAGIALGCGGLSASIDTLTPATGPAIPAARSYCSDHPGTTVTVPAGGTLSSYAVFDAVDTAAGPYTFDWQGKTQISGSIGGIAIP